MSRLRIVVVGAGLAGLAAALDCADAGAEVTVVERRSRLGGLTWSFTHNGYEVDNGQHVFLRCCHAYLGFLERIGSRGDVELQDRLDVTVLDPARRRAARLRRNGLPAPLQLGGSLLRYRHLSLADRLRIGQAALPLRTVALDDPALDQVTFAEWLGARGQSPAAIARLWDLITLATVNLPAAEASATMGAKVFQTGLLTETAAADIGWSRVPLGRLHGAAAAGALARAGARVLTGCRVQRVAAPAARGVRVSLENGDELDADAAVVAVPHWALAGVLDPAIAPGVDPSGLGTSPIVNVHVVYDRPVTTLPMAAALGGAAQWIFDRTASSGLREGAGDRRQYLAVTLSAADEHLGRPPAEVAAGVTAALEQVFPDARKATVLDTLVTKERAATFRATPASAARRPGPNTSAPTVTVAGAWTDTGWPATMEGAVRSGHAAARAALIGAGTTRRLPEEVA